jgi:transcriptional regulator with XRE-family HTH domain
MNSDNLHHFARRRLPMAEIAQLGWRIQERRLQRGMTLDVISQRTGFSKGYLSRIENGRKTPPLPTLGRIAAALGTEVQALLAASARLDGLPQYRVRRAGERPVVERDGSRLGYRYEALAPDDAFARMAPFVVHLPRDVDRHVFFEHDGEEFAYVLSGRTAWQVGDERHVLEAGDTVLLDSRLPHRACAIDGDATVLIVLLPRREMLPAGSPVRAGAWSVGDGAEPPREVEAVAA